MAHLLHRAAIISHSGLLECFRLVRRIAKQRRGFKPAKLTHQLSNLCGASLSRFIAGDWSQSCRWCIRDINGVRRRGIHEYLNSVEAGGGHERRHATERSSVCCDPTRRRAAAGRTGRVRSDRGTPSAQLTDHLPTYDHHAARHDVVRSSVQTSFAPRNLFYWYNVRRTKRQWPTQCFILGV